MPQFQEQTKGQARIRVMPGDTTRAYLLIVHLTAGKLQALPGDIYVVPDSVLPKLTENGVAFELMEKK